MEQNRTIRRATPQDYQVIATIYNEYIELGNATMEEIPKTVEDIAGWVKKFHNREALYVLETNGTVIGWGIIKRYSDREGYKYACETAVYLTSTELGKGHGSFIKKHLIEECRKMEYRHLVAKIFAINEVSIQYNLRQGYTIVGRQEKIGFRNNQWQDMIIMQLLLY